MLKGLFLYVGRECIIDKNIVLKRTEFVSRYLKRLAQQHIELLDLNMIEPFYFEDKSRHPSSIVFERNNEMQAIRSDWTRSLLNYRNRYNLKDNKFGYFGPVIRENQTTYQAGLEIFDASEEEIIESLSSHLDFIQKESNGSSRLIIINDVELIELFLDKYQLDSALKKDIFNKNFSNLAEHVGKDHPLYIVMTVPVSQQYELVKQELKDTKQIQFIEKVEEAIQGFNMKFILDLSFRSPQTYYDGIYCQVFLDKNIPVLSGGQYEGSAFGLAINLTDGGIF